MSPAALTSFKHNNDRYSIFNQYPQPTTHQPGTYSYPVFSSLRTMNSTRKGLRVNFAFFQGNYAVIQGNDECTAESTEIPVTLEDQSIEPNFSNDNITNLLQNLNPKKSLDRTNCRTLCSTNVRNL